MPRAHTSLRSLLAGENAGQPAVMLWKHFYTDDPRKLAQSTVRFYREHGLSTAKIMPDVPLMFGDQTLTSWRQVAQLRGIVGLGRAGDYIETVRRTREMLGPEDDLVVTIFAPLGLLGMWCGPDVFLEMAEAPKAEAHAVLGELGEGIAALARACRVAGANGVYYSCWGQDRLGAEAYREFGIPYDLAGLRGTESFDMRLLHVHGGVGSDLSTYAAYPVDVVGWSAVETGIAVADGAATLGGKIPMGGVNEHVVRPLDQVAVADMRRGLATLSGTLGGRLVVAPGCSLPDDLTEAEMAALREAAQLEP